MVRLILLLLFGWCVGLSATELDLTRTPEGSLGRRAEYLPETGAMLSVEMARTAYQRGAFLPGMEDALTFGIGSVPVWLRLGVVNPGDQPLHRRLTVGTTWIDRLDIHVVHRESLDWQVRTGDALPNPPGVMPGRGYAFDLVFPPGHSEIYIRADTVDPLVLPLELDTIAGAHARDGWLRYAFGFLYGGLISLIAYNLLLYVGLRERGHLYYSLYLFSFIALNFAYSGHGVALIWPSSPEFQRFVILVAMVAYSCSGLLFASRFLKLAEHAPHLLRAVRVFAFFGMAGIAASVAMGSQFGSAMVAFCFMVTFTFVMFGLGVVTFRQRRTAGGYFLSAATFGMLGAAATTLSVWGWIPFNRWTYHSIDVGILIEATLLALALAHYVRTHKLAYEHAEHLARHDVLTDLPNRRALLERLEQDLALALREQAHFSLMFVDLDNFKPINDKLGHAAGDWLLKAAAQRMRAVVRVSDTVSRFGGDEFVVLLSRTRDADEALAVAEKLRNALAEPFAYRAQPIALSCSIGVAVFPEHGTTVRDLLKSCDDAMYVAKAGGRNHVMLARPQVIDQLAETGQQLSGRHIITFHWRRAYQSGNPFIDAEHRELFERINELLRVGLGDEPDAPDFSEKVESLLEHVRAHFLHEEQLLAESGYDALDSHSATHRRLLEQADRLREQVRAGELRITDWLHFLANELIIGHILHEDRRYGLVFNPQ